VRPGAILREKKGGGELTVRPVLSFSRDHFHSREEEGEKKKGNLPASLFSPLATPGCRKKERSQDLHGSMEPHLLRTLLIPRGKRREEKSGPMVFHSVFCGDVHRNREKREKELGKARGSAVGVSSVYNSDAEGEKRALYPTLRQPEDRGKRKNLEGSFPSPA